MQRLEDIAGAYVPTVRPPVHGLVSDFEFLSLSTKLGKEIQYCMQSIVALLHNDNQIYVY